MYETVLAIVMQNQSNWSSFPAFSSLVGDFSAKLQELENLSLQQGIALPGVTAAKNDLRKKTTEKARVLFGALKAFSLFDGGAELAERVDVTQSDLNRMGNLQFKNQLDALLLLATEHLSELADYGVDQAKIDELQALRDQCAAVLGTPRQAIVDRKTVTKSIRVRVTALDELLKKGFDALMISFKNTVPDFYFHYKSARVIVDLKGRSGPNSDHSAA